MRYLAVLTLIITTTIFPNISSAQDTRKHRIGPAIGIPNSFISFRYDHFVTNQFSLTAGIGLGYYAGSSYYFFPRSSQSHNIFASIAAGKSATFTDVYTISGVGTGYSYKFRNRAELEFGIYYIDSRNTRSSQGIYEREKELEIGINVGFMLGSR